jgi:hypothetical protein
MSCGCTNYGNRGAVGNHCDSSAFDSSCTDEGHGYPLSVVVGCDVPVYTPIPDIVGVWNGTQWLLDSDSSSSSGSSSFFT